ncbi:MAG: hypothetical protein OEZ13_13630 [Spirochaetia bacterium]|nr:hypothetical protein [Spirochaetia bacterium]
MKGLNSKYALLARTLGILKNLKILRTLIFISAFFMTFSIQAQENKIRIAVLPFEHSDGVTASEAAYLTEAVRNTLIRTGIFEVISNYRLLSHNCLKNKWYNLHMGQ